VNKDLEDAVLAMADKYGVQDVIDALEMMDQDMQDRKAHEPK